MNHKDKLIQLKKSIGNAIDTFNNNSSLDNKLTHGKLILELSSIMHDLCNSSMSHTDDTYIAVSEVKSFMCDLNKLNKKILHDELNHQSTVTDVASLNTDTASLNTDMVMKMLGGEPSEQISELNTEKVMNELAYSDKLFVGNYLEDIINDSVSNLGNKYSIVYDHAKTDLFKYLVSKTNELYPVSSSDFKMLVNKMKPSNVSDNIFSDFLKNANYSTAEYGFIVVRRV